MEVRLDKIGSEPFRWQVRLEIPAETVDQDHLLQLGPLDWSGSVAKADSGFLLEAELGYEQVVACSRCLEPVTDKVDASIRLRIVTEPIEVTEEEMELAVDDLEICYALEVLNLDEIVAEQLQLNLPARPLCSESCQGLCPRCGVNRNTEQCACGLDEIDPRFEALRGLKIDN